MRAGRRLEQGQRRSNAVPHILWAREVLVDHLLYKEDMSWK